MTDNFLDMIAQGTADELWAKTEPLTDAEVTALVHRQRVIRERLEGDKAGWDEEPAE